MRTQAALTLLKPLSVKRLAPSPAAVGVLRDADQWGYEHVCEKWPLHPRASELGKYDFAGNWFPVSAACGSVADKWDACLQCVNDHLRSK